MKKLLALVLALIMVLGLGVTAFADTIKVIELQKEKEDDDEDLDVIKALPLYTATGEDDVYLCGADGGDFYFELNKEGLKDFEVSTTGNVTAEIVKFDGKTMEYEDDNVKYGVFDGTHRLDKEEINTIVDLSDAVDSGVFTTYADAEDAKDALNKKAKSSKYTVKAIEKNTSGAYVTINKDLLKVTVGENYTAAYKEGTVKVDAKNGKTKMTKKITIISDVTIFEYEQVKWAVDDGEALVIGDKGYSDYETSKLGYGEEYDEEKLRTVDNATVVSTTEFRYAEGEELEVETKGGFVTVTIDEVAKGQKGVNFAFEGFKFYDEDDEETTKKGDVEYFEFGFLGNQVIASDFEIEVKLGCDYYELRELFGKKVEEEDIITYYVLKDGVKIDEFTVDYANDDIDDDVELEILGKAGDKLGYYTITLDAPAAEEGEKNPNTGAESVVGVVAAMAVISLATAAAVSLKK